MYFVNAVASMNSINALYGYAVDFSTPFFLFTLPSFWRDCPTVGFSGSGGAGKTSSPENYFTGSRRIPSSGEAAVRLEPVLGGVLASVN